MKKIKAWWWKTDPEGLTNGDGVTMCLVQIVLLGSWAILCMAAFSD